MISNITLGYLFVFAGLALTVCYLLKLRLTKELKGKYDLINQYEIRTFRLATISIILGIELLVVFSQNPESLPELIGYIFIGLGSGAICIVLFYYLFKVYYPRFVENRLQTIRYTPRLSPKSGMPMVLLHESEEDAFLDESMLKDEELHSVDYDVWIDKLTGFVLIEKYYGYQHAMECPECGFQTMYITREEIMKHPTTVERGILLKHFKCRYCDHRFQQQVYLRVFNPGDNAIVAPGSVDTNQNVSK